MSSQTCHWSFELVNCQQGPLWRFPRTATAANSAAASAATRNGSGAGWRQGAPAAKRSGSVATHQAPGVVVVEVPSGGFTWAG